MIDFKKLLPKRLQSTTWGSIIESSENFLKTEIKDNYIDPKYYTYPKYFNASIDDIKIFIDEMGDVYNTYDGYTSTKEFFLRRLYTLTDRRQYRKLPLGYLKVLFMYCLSGNVYPLLNMGSVLDAWEEYYEVPESIISYVSLDTGWNLDAGLTLDNFEYYSQLTNHFIVEYQHNFIEDATTFISEATSLALLRDIELQKKIIEVPHFECQIDVYANTSNPVGNPLLTPYTDCTHTISANQSTFFEIGLLSQYSTLELSYNSTNVQTFTIGVDFDVLVDTIIGGQQQLFIKQLITWDTKLLSFNEITLRNVFANIIVKATIPTINFHPSMLSSVRIHFYLD